MRAILVACLVLAIAGAPVGATTYTDTSLAAGIDEADVIFVGTLESIEYYELKPQTGGVAPFTFFAFHVDQVLKGGTADQRLVLRAFGGRYTENGEVAWVKNNAMPPEPFVVGERYLLFVVGNGSYPAPIVARHLYRLVQLNSGDTEIVDWTGHAIRSIRNDGTDWVKSDQPLDTSEGSLAARGALTTASLIREPAAGVIALLRETISARRNEPSYLAGSTVSSASVEDLVGK